jgi:transposase
MKAYSQDFRERALAALEAGEQARAELSETFRVSESMIAKWKERWRDTGSVAALPFGGGRQRALKVCAAVIQAEVKQQPDVTLEELCERVEGQTGVAASRSMMSHELPVLALPHKKWLHDSERDTPMNTWFLIKWSYMLTRLDPETLGGDLRCGIRRPTLPQEAIHVRS